MIDSVYLWLHWFKLQQQLRLCEQGIRLGGMKFFIQEDKLRSQQYVDRRYSKSSVM